MDMLVKINFHPASQVVDQENQRILKMLLKRTAEIHQRIQNMVLEVPEINLQMAEAVLLKIVQLETKNQIKVRIPEEKEDRIIILAKKMCQDYRNQGTSFSFYKYLNKNKILQSLI